MRKLIFLLAFLPTAAFAQQPADPLIQNLTDDWMLMQGGQKHVAASLDGIIKAYQAAKAEADAAKTENERLKKLLDDKGAVQ